ncbi:HDOD domain-containing protein [Fusibacter tunisiensis]|uniref:Stage 0 sporulation protein A homolog n=1 Tax=Fusibacter tunisiensis TaxID=1008308 RepID=A0ABS2MPW6_9FIRM|nr:HDOD domain-containing protein [Fusibacter tunisiensis]MBM7561425.1 HD-like signal output (HDOD) protein [Fusibacter tunisiensis]
MSKVIAFVDDEQQILRALKRLFFQTDYTCLFFDKGGDLIQYLESNKIDILVTDIRMPEMDGIALMHAVKRMQPKVIRIALSGYTDSRQILAALDSGLARLYIYKPWDNDQLLSKIEGLIRMNDQLADPSLLQEINGLGSLPTIPDLYAKITDLIEKEASAQEVARLVDSDPAIAGKLLRIANTAYYGLHTGSVQQAIVMLGMSNVRQIILTNSVFERAAYMPYAKDLWQHASLVNQGVAYLYSLCYGKSLPNHQGTAGLMHTLGLLFLATVKTDLYLELIEAVEKELQHSQTDNNQSIFDALETEFLPVRHPEIGSFLLNWWELPFDIIEVAYHYREPKPELIVNKELVAMVHLVSHVAFGLLGLTQFQYALDKEFCDANGNLTRHQLAIEDYLASLLTN